MPCKPVLKKTVHNKAQSFREMLEEKKKNLSADIEVHSNTDQ